MNIIVDANIIFSGILNTNGKIGDLLMNSTSQLNFISPDFLRREIRQHYPKLIKISKLSLEQVQEAEFQIYRHITFISEEQIKLSSWLQAEKLVHDVDPKDISYIAYSINFGYKVWSGDKALINGLLKKALLKLQTRKRYII
ncbi:PIN domain-containing protein [Arcticibacter eurypsychrophilus]|uniref:PIN domain-containing protein n=1 Tax=Arcticibacter eurypsychrophilus TaxID=1434752 RepID=UPI00084DCF32|nr:PIN domain-containing protein [Arcticibacter eurypsychrophilus]